MIYWQQLIQNRCTEAFLILGKLTLYTLGFNNNKRVIKFWMQATKLHYESFAACPLHHTFLESSSWRLGLSSDAAPPSVKNIFYQAAHMFCEPCLLLPRKTLVISNRNIASVGPTRQASAQSHGNRKLSSELQVIWLVNRNACRKKTLKKSPLSNK